MSEQHLNNFWTKCEDQLKYYTNLFNLDMHSKGFKVQYKVLDKTPIAVCYTLIMTYQQQSAQSADVLLSSMHVLREIVSSIRELLYVIQQ